MLFGSLKVKRLHGMHFATCRRAKDEVIDWLQFYHHRRLHSTLGYLSPMAFEKKRLAEKERARHAIEFFIRVASAVRQALCLRGNRSIVISALCLA
jgi:hypothetical protein